MIIIKTVFYLVKQMVRKAKAPSLKDIMVYVGVISLTGFVCLLIGRKMAK